MDVLKLPSFKKPVSKQEAVAIYTHWQYGDSITHIASFSRMSNKKVSEIISTFPNDWKSDVSEYRKHWN